MADQFGAISFPVDAPTSGTSVNDPALDYIAQYVQACCNFQLAASWGSVNPGKKFIQSYQTQSPGDTFNDRDLPCLYVWRSHETNDRVTDDWVETTTDVTLTWVPQNADQAKRSLREPGANGFQKVVGRALALGRSPVWVDPLDPATDAKTLGSVLIDRAKLFREPFLTTARQDTVVITKGTQTSTYPAFTLMMKIHEITQWDPSFDSIAMAPRAPSKLDETVTSGNFSLESLIPTT